MRKAPGHQKWPDHEVSEKQLDRKLRVEAGGEVVAESSDVIEVDEDGHPARFYFPRADVDMDHLEASGEATECPFKGSGRYFDVHASDRTLENAAWSYEETYQEHRTLKDRIAFHEREVDALELEGAS